MSEVMQSMSCIVNYLGCYSTPPIVTKEKKIVVKAKKDPEISMWLKQLRNHTEYVGLHSGYQKRSYLTSDVAFIDKEINEELLMKPVLYYCPQSSSFSSHIFDSYVLAGKVPGIFFKHYHHFMCLVTENAKDRIDQLVREGKCNWIYYSKSWNYSERDTIISSIGDYYGVLSYFIKDSNNLEILELLCKTELIEFIPPPLINLTKWSDDLIKVVRYCGSSNSTDKLDKQFDPYKIERNNNTIMARLFGVHLAPHYKVFLAAIRSPDSFMSILNALAFKLRADGADIHR